MFQIFLKDENDADEMYEDADEDETFEDTDDHKNGLQNGDAEEQS